MAYPEIPEAIRRRLDTLRVEAAAAFQREEWDTAARRLKETYEFLLSQQQHYNRRFHKGWELHNLGIARFQARKLHGSVDNILLAYIEDALSTQLGDEDTADDGLAGMTMRDFPVYTDMLLEIKAIARRQKEANQIAFNPEEIAREALRDAFKSDEEVQEEAHAQVRERKVEPKRTIEGLTLPYERRCFVGGNYFVGGPYLEEIKQAVSDAECDPIVARDFEIERGDIHHRSLLLLHLCSKAIFEVTVPAGQLMELERCRDYDVKPRLLRHIASDADPNVSQMISTMADADVYPYSTSEEMREIVASYLRE